MSILRYKDDKRQVSNVRQKSGTAAGTREVPLVKNDKELAMYRLNLNRFGSKEKK